MAALPDKATVNARRWLGLYGALVLVAGIAACQRWHGSDPGTLAAASSLRTVVPALLAAHRKVAGAAPVRVTYGASGSLQRQIEGGAPISGVLFASRAPVDRLIAKGLVVPHSRRQVATNQLVLIAPSSGPRALQLTFRTLETLPPDAKLAIGDPAAVPAGAYARETLQRLGSWQRLKDRLVYGGDVAMVLAYARRGEIDAAIVYRTDIRGVDDVTVLDHASAAWSPTPEVVVAVTAAARNQPAITHFLDFVASPAGPSRLGLARIRSAASGPFTE